MAEPPDLLFFDTFSHESSEELNLDLVQFPKPVYVSEVRIIPLGAKVQGDFPGGVRLGATNPSQFQIDFFVNDLGKPGASTFESLGTLDYCQNGRIHMDCEPSDRSRQIPTDGLVLRGWYTTITLAVYGTIPKNITEQINTGPNSVAEGTSPLSASASTPPTVANNQQWSEPPVDAYPTSNYPPDGYEPTNYPPEFYNQDVPKDPRAYHHHHSADPPIGAWDEKERHEREVSRPRDKERIILPPIPRDEGDRLRSRSTERGRSRERISPCYSRSRSREQEYAMRPSGRDESFRRDPSRSPGYRERSPSRDKDWDRNYKRDDIRRHGGRSSYERSRGGSYERKRVSPYEKRPPSYERRPPSYDNCTPYEKRGSSYEKHPYEKRTSPYEKRAPSYEKRPFDKRAPSYDRTREQSFDGRSRSPGREDPRKRPRTPPMDHPRRPHTPVEAESSHDRENISPVDSAASEEVSADYDRNRKVTPSKDESFSKNLKSRKPSSKSESEKPLTPKDSSSFDMQHPINIPVIPAEPQPSLGTKVNTPLGSPIVLEDAVSMDTEPFEPILSDEDICDDIDGNFTEEYEMNDYCEVEDVIKFFNPFRSDWQAYVPVNKSILFLSSDGSKDVMSSTLSELCVLNADFQKLYEIVCEFNKAKEKYTLNNFSELSNEIKEEWVNICEQLPHLITNIASESDILFKIFQLSEIKPDHEDEFENILVFLLHFCRIGLDYDCALSQYQATCKIRHIKCGIRLIDALAAHKYNERAVTTLLNNNIDIFTKLLEMYSKDYMALSIKLMILKALDSCLGSEATIEHFLTRRFVYRFIDNQDPNNIVDLTVESDMSDLRNGYQVLLVMLRKNPLSRVKFAINALINKINFYELLKKFYETILQLNVKETRGQGISEMEIEFIINSLEEILCVYRSGSFELSQPRRFLPVSVQFEINKCSSNTILLDFFRIHKVIETFLYLFTCPLTYNYPVITNPIYEILTHLISDHEGLVYLVENIKVCHLIFQSLMQPFSHQSEEDQMMALQDFSNCTSMQQLGIEMAFKIQAIYYIHLLTDIENKVDVTESELFDNLHNLFCLGFGNMGKLALASVLSMGDNIQCLLNIFEKDINTKPGEKEDPQTNKTKSPIKNYAVDLTVSTIQFSVDVEFLNKYGKRILNIAKKFDVFEQSISSNLQEVLPYLKPLEKSNIFLKNSISELVDILKASVDHVTSSPGDLITCLRILKSLGIPEIENKKLPLSENPKVEFTELKYKYIVTQLYSLDGVSLLLSVLEKITAYFEQPSLHSATFSSTYGLHIVNIVLPALELLNKMLAYVIQCRNTKYKDLTPIPVIMQTYNLLYSYPANSAGYKMAQKGCRECIEILLAHTQPIAEDASENESIHKSLWTLLCGEVIKFVLTAPYTFLPGLLVLSEILPLPLPIQTKYTLSDSELAHMVRNRKLWSAHLHTLSFNITDMIKSICSSVCQPVIQLLKRVCIQLADLGSNISLCVTRAILDLLLEHHCDENNCLPQPPKLATSDIARILNFLACVATHPSIKCTILHLIRQSTSVTKSDDKYSLFVPMICSILTLTSDSPAHIQAQECITSIISNFYDSEITLFTQIENSQTAKNENQDEVIDLVKSESQYLANAIPHKDALVMLLNASFEYISNENTHASSMSTLAILRTFFLVIEHDFGFYHFKSCLEKNKNVFSQVFARLVNNIGKDSPECISTLLELFKVLQSPSDDLESTEFTPRTSVMTIGEIADMIGWFKNRENHPILTLEKFLKEVNAEDVLSLQVRQFLSSLMNCTPPAPATDSAILPIPPTLGTPEHLVNQFNTRCLWTQGDAQDERLGSSYWLGIAMPHAEDEVVEAEMKPCDVIDLTRTYLPPGTDLVAEAERLLHLPPAAPRPPSEPPLFRTKRVHVPRDKRPYVSPARGRGIQQQIGGSSGINVSGGPRTQVDAFRSRPPNTSRPPSLHVDDFLALEGCGAQPTGPTGYNKLPIMSTRGNRGTRTRGIAITDRGRYASATPTSSTIYNRRGRGTWATANSTGSILVPEGSPPVSSHYSRVSTSHYQSPSLQHTSNGANWSGSSRGSRRGRGLRHSRAPFLR